MTEIDGQRNPEEKAADGSVGKVADGQGGAGLPDPTMRVGDRAPLVPDAALDEVEALVERVNREEEAAGGTVGTVADGLVLERPVLDAGGVAVGYLPVEIRDHDPEPGRCIGLGAGCPGCVDLYLAASGQDPDRDQPPWCALCCGQHWAWNGHQG